MEKRGCLYVGGDDSNHAGIARGEIIVATFSFNHDDSIVKKFPNKREYESTFKWINSPERDYRYALLTSERYRNSSQNLLVLMPSLIKLFMNNEDINVDVLKLFLDGRLDTGVRSRIREEFLGFRGIEGVVVDNFIKKKKIKGGHVEKHPECPALVYHADVLANYFYSNSIENPKLVIID
jgi:hypothetical protein